MLLSVNYYKGSPTEYCMHYVGANLKQKGRSLSFFYWAPNSTIIAISLETRDFPYAFSLTSADHQEVSVQGSVTFRVKDPDKLAEAMDFSINENKKYNKDVISLLNERVLQVVQIYTKEFVHKYDLIEVLSKLNDLSNYTLDKVYNDKIIEMLGLEILAISIRTLTATPTMIRALEAATRENLQKKADEAVYSRRNAVVEQERIIKENEFKTEIAMEEKKREIRESKIAADIAIEQQKEKLISMRIQNDKKEAESKAYALEIMLKPLRNTDWRTLLASQEGGLDAKSLIAMAFRDMADNAGKIGNLNISPDILSNLLGDTKHDCR